MSTRHAGGLVSETLRRDPAAAKTPGAEPAAATDGDCIRVLIIEAHPIVRWALGRMTDRERDLNTVGTAEDVDEAIELIADLRPNVVTLSIEVGHTPMELGRVPELRELFPSLGVVVLASEPDDDLLFQSLDVEASAFVIKRAPVDEILSAVRHAAVASGSFSATGLADALRRRNAADRRPVLADRDREVLRMLHCGMSTNDVAKRMYVSHSTAKSRIAHLYHSLGAANRAQALMAAVRMGLIEP